MYSPQFYLWWSLFLRGFVIIAAERSGWVRILLKRPNGITLGETKIYYYDEEDMACKLVTKNPKLQARIFRNFAEGLDNHDIETLSSGEAQNSGICGEWRTLLITAKFHEKYSSTTACVLTDANESKNPIWWNFYKMSRIMQGLNLESLLTSQPAVWASY